MLNAIKKQEEKRKGRQSWTKWLVLSDKRKYGRKGKQRRREIKGCLLNAIRKQEEKRKGRQRWTKWLVLNDVRKRERYAENKTREI